MKKTFQTRLALTALATLLAQGAAQAETKTSSFDSRIQVNATCSISATDLTFDAITTGTTPNVDASSEISVDCSSGTPYQVALSNGANFDQTRRMAWGASYVGYGLFSNTTRTAAWDSTNTVTGTGTGALQTIPVYGRVFAGQNVTNTGSYADTIVATVTY